MAAPPDRNAAAATFGAYPAPTRSTSPSRDARGRGQDPPLDEFARPSSVAPPVPAPPSIKPEMVDVSGGGGGEPTAEAPAGSAPPTGQAAPAAAPLVVPAIPAPEDVSLLGGITWQTVKQKLCHDWRTSDVGATGGANIALYGTLIASLVLDVVATIMRLASDNAPPTWCGI